MKWVGILGVIAVVACGSSVDPPAPVVAEYQASGASILSTYPSDRFTVPDATTATGLRVRIDGQATADPVLLQFPQTIVQLNELDGFSTVGGAFTNFSGPLDVRGIAVDAKADPPDATPLRLAAEYTKPGSPMYLIDSDPKSPEKGSLVGLIPKYWAQEKDLDYDHYDYTLLAQPARPLRPGTRYLFVVTNALKGKNGVPVVASSETTALLAASASPYQVAIKDGLAILKEKVALDASSVVLATSFTTATPTSATFAMAKRARTTLVPTLVEPWTIETPLAPDGRVRYRARFEVPEYRDPSDGRWHVENALPKEVKKTSLEVFLSFSNGNKTGKRPVVIYQHGLGGDKDGTWGTTQRLADLGCAVIGIDSPEHGSRAPGGTTDTIVWITSFLGVDLGAKTFDVGKASDNFREMASDQLELVRFLGAEKDLDLLPVGAPDGIPDLDVSQILYIGHSFGSVQGATILSIAPEIEHAVWNVGGAGLTVLLRESGLFSLVLKGLRPPGTPEGSLGRFFSIIQAVVDPGDAANYARYVALEAPPDVVGWKPRDVLLQESVPDGIVPNASSEVLARAAGLTLQNAIVPISGLSGASGPITGNLPGGATGVIAQFDKIDGGMSSSHGELIFSPEAQKQYVGFFASGLASGHATVPPAYP
ncbi:hypothetical protein BH09MYX1_BH09MYX1_03270 [soil metagenome]